MPPFQATLISLTRDEGGLNLFTPDKATLTSSTPDEASTMLDGAYVDGTPVPYDVLSYVEDMTFFPPHPLTKREV